MIDQVFQGAIALMGFWFAVVVFFVLGLAGLKYGADWLVNGASNIGFRLGLSATMIGLTIVALGTSAPELVVSLLTAAKEQPELALGNVVGSNVANTTLILGATALVFPLVIQKGSIRADAPLSFAAIAMVWILAVIGNELSRLDGFLLLLAFFIWMGWLINTSRKQARAERARKAESGEDVVFYRRSPVLDITWVIIGLAALVLGADAMVASAVATARALAVPDIVVGLTVIAGGTSLPELAVCLVAALRKQADITVANVMGSNVFNALLITGTAASIYPIVFDGPSGPSTLFIDIPFCVGVCLLVIPLMAHRMQLTRLKGSLLVSLYVGYIGFLIWRNLG